MSQAVTEPFIGMRELPSHSEEHSRACVEVVTIADVEPGCAQWGEEAVSVKRSPLEWFLGPYCEIQYRRQCFGGQMCVSLLCKQIKF